MITHFFSVRAKWVTIHGTKYKVGATLHIGYSEDELPLFWGVDKIAIVNKYVRDIMFIVSEKETLHFNKHFQCYEVVIPANPMTKVAYVKDFSCILPLSQTKSLGTRTSSRFICVRYDLEV